jgi:hypothetical protein
VPAGHSATVVVKTGFFQDRRNLDRKVLDSATLAGKLDLRLFRLRAPSQLEDVTEVLRKLQQEGSHTEDSDEEEES